MWIGEGNMEETIIKIKQTFGQVFKVFLIRNYLHRRLYSILIVVIKVLSIMLFFMYRGDSLTGQIFGVFMFFYFELYIIYRYFRMKKIFMAQYGSTERNVTLILKEYEIEIEDRFRNTTINWNQFDTVKETKWFLFFKKNNIVIFFLDKINESKSNILALKNYLRERNNLHADFDLFLMNDE